MKKAKAVLTMIAFIAVFSGALAFKAKRGTDIWCKAKSAGTGTQCKIWNNFTYVIGNEPTDTLYCTDVDPGVSGVCPTRSHLVDQE